MVLFFLCFFMFIWLYGYANYNARAWIPVLKENILAPCMVLILGGKPEIRRNLCNLICIKLLISSRAITNHVFFINAPSRSNSLKHFINAHWILINYLIKQPWWVVRLKTTKRLTRIARRYCMPKKSWPILNNKKNNNS